MKKKWLYRLFRIGGIPAKLRPVLESEGLVVRDEGIGGRMVMEDFKAPGKRFNHRRTGFTGFLAVTQKRVIAHAFGKRILHVPFDHSKFDALQAKLVDPEHIELSFESSDFQDTWSGRVLLRFNTPKAARFFDALARSG